MILMLPLHNQIPNNKALLYSTSSVANNNRNKRPKVVDEMTKQFSSMARVVAGAGPKLDGLVHVL